jgi:hypothetical protein
MLYERGSLPVSIGRSCSWEVDFFVWNPFRSVDGDGSKLLGFRFEKNIKKESGHEIGDLWIINVQLEAIL